MTKVELPFSHQYPKLDYAVFPTIRRRDKYGTVGDTLTVVYSPNARRNEELGEASIIAKEKRSLTDMTTAFLCHDTNSDTFSGAVESINEFYRKPIEADEQLTLYWLKWE